MGSDRPPTVGTGPPLHPASHGPYPNEGRIRTRSAAVPPPPKGGVGGEAGSPEPISRRPCDAGPHLARRLGTLRPASMGRPARGETRTPSFWTAFRRRDARPARPNALRSRPHGSRRDTTILIGLSQKRVAARGRGRSPHSSEPILSKPATGQTCVERPRSTLDHPLLTRSCQIATKSCPGV